MRVSRVGRVFVIGIALVAFGTTNIAAAATSAWQHHFLWQLHRTTHGSDFNPAAIGGIGTYTMEMAGNSPSSSGPYEISIFGVADGGGQPPVIAGSAGGTPAAVPTLSTVGILGLLVLVAALTALLRRSGISQN